MSSIKESPPLAPRSYELSPEEQQREKDDKRRELFLPLGAQVSDLDTREGQEDGSQLVDKLESLCMRCGDNGETRILLTKIPYFREIILMSFYCEHCHEKNTEVQFAGEIQQLGAKCTLRLDTIADLSRQIVKSDTATFKIEELDFEIPAGKGRLTNIEGFVADAIKDLELDQDRRRQSEPEIYEQIEKFISKLKTIVDGSGFPVHVTIDDIAGNSWIEPSPIDEGKKYVKSQYRRTAEQNASLGLASIEDDETEESNPADKTTSASVNGSGPISVDDVDILEGKVYTIPETCPGCSKSAAMNMQMVNIPYFKQVILMALVCSHCGFKNSEVKTGGEVPSKGRRIWLEVKGQEDLKRDILKSETCNLKVPKCGLDVQPGSMGGRFTTLEGLLTQVRDDLRSSIFDTDDVGEGGDSMPLSQKTEWENFFSTLDKAINAEMEYTVLLEDPLAASYVQSYTAPDPDPQIKVEDYDRTREEEDDLGLSDMKTVRGADGEYVREAVGGGEQVEAATVSGQEEKNAPGAHDGVLTANTHH